MMPGKGVNPRPRELRGVPQPPECQALGCRKGASPPPLWRRGGCLLSRAHLEQPQQRVSLEPSSGWPCPPPAPEALLSHTGATLMALCAVLPQDTPS